ncbi:hypothetical protein HDV06_005034 [Boothiomyces sp. JEL0866]|nr:hypothetical protein HDV06_005034 [Boothiomyces sp. JEL0866]
MKFILLCAAATAHIHLTSPISRNLTTAGTEDENAQLIGPCGGKTIPGPRSQQPLQFSITLDNTDSNAEVWINAAAGDNPTTFPSSLFNANFTNPGNVTLAIDLTQIPGLNGLTPVTIQIVQSAADAPQDKFICADLLVNAPVVSTTTTSTATLSTTTTVHLAATIPANSEMAATVVADTLVGQTTSLPMTINEAIPTPNAGYYTPGAVYQTPVAVYTTGPINSPSTTNLPKINSGISLKPFLLLIPFIL